LGAEGILRPMGIKGREGGQDYTIRSFMNCTLQQTSLYILKEGECDWRCMKYGWERRMGNLKGKSHLEDLGIDDITKIILGKCGESL